MQINYVDQLMRNELHFGLLFIYNEDIVRKDNNKIIVCIDDDNNISIADTKKPELIIYKPKLNGNYAEEILTKKSSILLKYMDEILTYTVYFQIKVIKIYLY